MGSLVILGLIVVATWWAVKRLFLTRRATAALLDLDEPDDASALRIYPGQRHRPPGKWRRVEPWFQVAGAVYRIDDAVSFVLGAAECEKAGTPYGLDVEREPENPHDPKAIAIFGWWTSPAGRQRVKIGYAPRDVARDHRDPDKPIAAEIENLYLANRYDGNGMYVGVRAFMLEPSARSGYWVQRSRRR